MRFDKCRYVIGVANHVIRQWADKRKDVYIEKSYQELYLEERRDHPPLIRVVLEIKIFVERQTDERGDVLLGHRPLFPPGTQLDVKLIAHDNGVPGIMIGAREHRHAPFRRRADRAARHNTGTGID